ncbi:uncharacterized protein LOC112529605 [Cynara cardunculus var. scolymus]|uniref:Secreted protein n=1 Tax=Cynara cardunculus var. scolymus TaxID=59895 RepID=A0A103XJG4_CYNCS|nr:uncharacterized protein LOC112529605 [Cynara cardunculus var. scolymus]KVH91724.1 hypothetical protein Ccrd_006260 [Cynara cardunculus var. scolymus]
MKSVVVKWILAFLGFGNHQVNGASEDAKDVNGHNDSNSVEEPPHHVNSNRHRKGISVSVQVPADRPHEIGPVIVPCPAGDGGVQGLNWHTRRLKIDEDGDVADEFLEEIVPETSHGLHHPTLSQVSSQAKRQVCESNRPTLVTRRNGSVVRECWR